MKDEGGGNITPYVKTDLKSRTKKFSLEIVRLFASLSKKTEAQVLGRQLLRSGTSVGAHYSEAQRAKSNADFISKIEGGLQELEETQYWLELLCDSGLVKKEHSLTLVREADELIAIFVSIVNKTKSRLNSKFK
jgi:four helix bundle protein